METDQTPKVFRLYIKDRIMSDFEQLNFFEEDEKSYYTGFVVDSNHLASLGVKGKHIPSLARFSDVSKEEFFKTLSIEDQLRKLAFTLKTQGYGFSIFEYVSKYQNYITPEESFFHTIWETSGFITYEGLRTEKGDTVVFSYRAPKQKHPYEFEDLTQALGWFDAHFYIEQVGTELYVFDKAFLKKMSITAFLNQEASKTIPPVQVEADEEEEPNRGRGRPPKVCLPKVWMNQTTNMIKESFFDPGRKPGVDYDLQTKNLYTGFAYSPLSIVTPGVEEFLTFIREGLANGREDIATYLIDWMSHLVQRPQELPGVAIVLHGIEGTGKGYFASVMQGLCQGYTAEVKDKKQVFGEFNSTLENKLFLSLDEALFHGDLAAIDAFKGSVTNPELRVRRMREDAYKATNYCRFVVTSNHKVPINITETDRRFVILNPSTKNVVSLSKDPEKSRSYWKHLNDLTKETTFFPSLLGYLISREITVDIMTPPKTAEKQNLVSYSLSQEQVFFRELIEEGFWLSGKLTSFDEDEIIVNKQEMYEAYIESCRSQKYISPLGKNLFFKTLKETFPTGLTEAPRHHNGPRMFLFLRADMINDLAGKGV